MGWVRTVIDEFGDNESSLMNSQTQKCGKSWSYVLRAVHPDCAQVINYGTESTTWPPFRPPGHLSGLS